MAVYTDITKNDIEELLQNYDLGNLQDFSPIAAGINNSNYVITTDKDKYLLTILEDFSPGKEALPFITGFMQHLYKEKIPCPLPIVDKSGNTIQDYKGKPLVLISFLNGAHPKDITTTHCSAIGANLAKMHIAGQGFKQLRENPWSIPNLINTKGDYLIHADKFKNDLKNKLEKTSQNILENWPNNLPKGVIHADLFPDNILFKNDKLNGIIDFYLSGSDLLAYDLAICINAWCFDNKAINTEKLHSLVSAYQAVRPLEKEEISNLQILHQGASLRFLFTRLKEWYKETDDVLVTPHDPVEYIEKLEYHQTHDIRNMI